TRRRLSTETKSAFKTTELLAYLGTVVAILIAAQTIGNDSKAGSGGDYFRADKAFLYITLLTIGYLLSRGIAKSGSRDFYDDTHDH
ncbi:MAG: sle, partial [Frankiales bacterium]|nr:sle [Frankiales bacterium]